DGTSGGERPDGTGTRNDARLLAARRTDGRGGPRPTRRRRPGPDLSDGRQPRPRPARKGLSGADERRTAVPLSTAALVRGRLRPAAWRRGPPCLRRVSGRSAPPAGRAPQADVAGTPGARSHSQGGGPMNHLGMTLVT